MGSRGPARPGDDLPLAAPRERLRRALAGRTRQVVELPAHRRAAVLVPLLERNGEARVVLTLRSAALRAHGGQWSFPGGRVDDGDAHAAATALREAEEEIGVRPAAVDVLGLLGDSPTSTGFVITPVVGWLDRPPAAFVPSPAEVTEVAEIPLARFLAPGAVQIVGQIERGGRTLPVYSYPLEGRTIWGATARILHELGAVLA